MKEIEKIIKKLKNNNELHGIARRLDELGRIVIPIEYRNGKVEDGETNVEIYVIQDYVVVEILENKEENSRKIDELGRVVINKKIREQLEWEEKDHIEMWNYDKYFILKKIANWN